jgi:hypothetical protein
MPDATISRVSNLHCLRLRVFEALPIFWFCDH